MLEITDKPLQIEAITQKVRKDGYGAVVSYIGTVRSPSQGKEVRYLDYNRACAEAALPKLRQIAREIKERWGLEDVAISHRVGRLRPGEIVTVIAVGAPHRHEAFEACHHAINRIKEIEPLPKEEVFSDSTQVEGQH